jgi:hypothetical protein
MEIAFLMFWLICGIGAAAIASSKGRSGCWWFVIGVLIGPLALLIVGFMASATPPQLTTSAPRPTPPVAIPPATTTPSRPALYADDRNILYSDSTLRISKERIYFQNQEYTIRSLKPVSVRQVRPGDYVIDLYNLMDSRVAEINSSSPSYLKAVADAINGAISSLAPTVIPSTPNVPAPTDDRLKLLTELKQMLDASLITQAEYDTKKTEILGRM